MIDTKSKIHLLPTTINNKMYERNHQKAPPCHCCQSRSSPADIRRFQHQDVPKLLRYESPLHKLSRSGPTSPGAQHHVSVIKTSTIDYPPRPIKRTNSVSSVDQHSTDSQSERSFECRSPAPVSPSYTHHNSHHESSLESSRSYHDDFYRSLHSPPRRERLRVLQSDRNDQRSPLFNDYHDIPSPSYSHPPILPSFNLPHHPRMPENPHHFTFAPYLDANLTLRHKFPDFPDFSIKKRHRTIFTPSQLRTLEEKFNECNFIVGVDRSALAKQLKLKEHQVKIWFQNRRTKVKQLGKDKSEIDVVSC